MIPPARCPSCDSTRVSRIRRGLWCDDCRQSFWPGGKPRSHATKETRRMLDIEAAEARARAIEEREARLIERSPFLEEWEPLAAGIIKILDDAQCE